MAKIAVLVPYPEMCDEIRPLIGDYAHLSPMCVEYTRTEEVEARASELFRQGCELIVARGLQAELIKRRVALPVVEIRAAAQELGALLLDIKRSLGEERPKIAAISFGNMLCDTSRFSELFQVDFCRYEVCGGEELRAAVDRAIRDGYQAVVGGDVVCDKARTLGFPCRFIPSGQESLRDALNIANRICYSIDLDKSNSAERNAMLDFTFSGIMQVDREGVVCRANRVAFNLLGRSAEEMTGGSISDVLPQLAEAVLDKALREGRETYALLLPLRQKEVLVNIAPIFIDDTIRGAILTFQEGARIVEMDSELRRELYQRGYLARYSFDRLPPFDSGERTAFAKRIAKYGAPILITGEPGCGKGMLAQCVHNESLSRSRAFVQLDCSAYPPETLDIMLFGSYSTRKDAPACLVDAARDGTLYLSCVEALSPELQYKLLELLRGRFLHNRSSLPGTVNIRVIASSGANLTALVEQGEFREDLYYALSVLTLDLPPLRSRREVILLWVEFYLKDWQSRYKRYVSLTQGARSFLEDYDWPGNLDQLNSLCQRIVLLAERRTVDDAFLRRQTEQLAPRLLRGTDHVVVFQSEKAARITELLQKYDGNRQRVADEMGISKTTLWRYIKKYGIEQGIPY